MIIIEASNERKGGNVKNTRRRQDKRGGEREIIVNYHTYNHFAKKQLQSIIRVEKKSAFYTIANDTYYDRILF